jgi:hypothetical protein
MMPFIPTKLFILKKIAEDILKRIILISTCIHTIVQSNSSTCCRANDSDPISETQHPTSRISSINTLSFAIESNTLLVKYMQLRERGNIEQIASGTRRCDCKIWLNIGSIAKQIMSV